MRQVPAQPLHGRGLGPAGQRLAFGQQLAKGVQVEDKPSPKRAISSAPVVKPIRVNAPNSVFALGSSFAKT